MAEHLNTARDLASALTSGNIPAANKIAQGIGIQLGNDPTTNFNTLKQFLSGEVAKVASGGHLTEAEIQSASDKLNAAQSPAQLNGALNTMSQIAGGKLKALDVDYKNYSGGKSLVDAGRLSPAAKQAFQSSGGKGLQTLAPADAAKLPAGTHFLGQDGVERVAHGQ